jgi:hypothetical protein
LLAAGVPAAKATQISHLPPVGTLFAAFLGYNPMGVLLGPSIHHLSLAHAHQLTSRSYFPSLISAPFHAGLDKAFDFAAFACLVAAAASWLSGERYVHGATGSDESGGVIESVEAMGSGLMPLESVEEEDSLGAHDSDKALR